MISALAFWISHFFNLINCWEEAFGLLHHGNVQVWGFEFGPQVGQVEARDGQAKHDQNFHHLWGWPTEACLSGLSCWSTWLQTWTPHWLDHRKSQVQLSALHRKCTALRKNQKESFCQRLVSDLQLPCDLIKSSAPWSFKCIQEMFQKVTKNSLHSQAFQKYKSSKPDLPKALPSFFFRGSNAGQFEAAGAWHSRTSYVQRCLAKCHGELPG